ncbi:MAG: putrescine aminotransferase [Elusimicrobiota bacterium]|jgi:putrescine aminotransferase|nr:putrescine aminotransferase [Elusimicrobiota bacterium]
MDTQLKEANEVLDKVLGFIISDKLSDADKEQITKDVVFNFDKYLNPGWLLYRKSVSTKYVFVEWEDHESYFSDIYGEEFIDLLGGFGIYMFGHRNPEILKYVKAQLNRQALHSQELLDPLRSYLAQVLAKITPGDLQYSFFTNGGAEAVEMALKLARLATKKSWIISTVNGFHGKSMGAISVGGKDIYRTPYMPLVPHVAHAYYGDIDDMRNTIDKLSKVGESIAAVIIEPIQGEAGIILPPENYLKQVRAMCDEFEICLIFDEIQTGMGRTGNYFRCQYESVTPDILVYGKAFGGGIMPITGITARPHLWVKELQDNPYLLGSATFGGNPLACCAALAAINFMIKNDVPKMCREKGAYLMKALNKLKEKYPNIIMDIRGAGLMIGIDFLNTKIGYSFVKGLFDRKVLTAGTLNNATTIRIEPAAITSYEDFDKALTRMDESLAGVKAEFKL